MNDKIKAILAAIGITSDVISQLSDDTKAQEVVVADVVSAFGDAQKSKYTELIKNEGSLRSEIEASIKGSTYGTFRNDIKKRFGDIIDLSNAELQKKEPHELLEMVKSGIAGKAGGSGKDAETIKEQQAKIVSLQAEIDKFETEVKPKIEQAAAQKIADFQATSLVKGHLAKMKGDNKIIGEVDGVFAAINAVSSTKYDTGINEKGELEYFVKGTDRKQRVQGKVDGVEKILSSEEILMEELNNFGFVRKSNGDPSGEKGGKGNLPEYDPQKLSTAAKKGMSAADARLAELDAKIS